MNWNLLACAFTHHVSYAPVEPEFRARLQTATPSGEAWQCLRCATFVPGPPAASGPAAAAPRVRRDDELRSALILRFFALERFVRAIIFGFIAYGVWRFKYSRYTIQREFNREYPEVRNLLHELGYNVNRSGLVGLIRHTFTLDQRTLTWLAIGAAAYTVVVTLEAIALWGLRRWGEYFAMVATCAGIPYEIYELVAKVTALRMTAFAINVALVVYLVLSKRLFGARGGKKAYDARLRSESVMQAAVDAAAAARGHPDDTPVPLLPVPDGTASGGAETSGEITGAETSGAETGGVEAGGAGAGHPPAEGAGATPGARPELRGRPAG